MEGYLRRNAKKAARYRGHNLGPWQAVAGMHTAVCQDCGLGVDIVPHPAPNEIEVGGRALAMPCTRMCRRNWKRHALLTWLSWTYDGMGDWRYQMMGELLRSFRRMGVDSPLDYPITPEGLDLCKALDAKAEDYWG